MTGTAAFELRAVRLGSTEPKGLSVTAAMTTLAVTRVTD